MSETRTSASAAAESHAAGGAQGGAGGPGRGSAVGILSKVVRLDEFGPALALVVLVAFIGLMHSDFLREDVLVNTFRQAAFVGIVSYGMVFLLAMTEIDLSVGGIYAITIILAAKWMANDAMSPYIAAVLAIGVAVLLGLANGVLANWFRIPVIIVTLGTLSMYRGLVTVISDGKPVEGIPIESSFFSTLGGKWIGLPVAGWFALGAAVVLTIVFTKTRFGAMVRAIGSNADAAHFSGIPADRIRLLALMLLGGLAGLAGVLSLAYFQGADPTIGTGFELQVIAAAIIGGTAVSGGSGSVPGALIGALIVSVISAGLIFFEIDANWTNFVTGAVIVVAVGSDALLRRRRSRLDARPILE
jgi:ribose transport system permease protein